MTMLWYAYVTHDFLLQFTPFLKFSHIIYIHYAFKKEVVVPEVQTADSCFSLIGPRQCSAALGGPATSNSRPKAPWGLKKARELQGTHRFHKGSLISILYLQIRLRLRLNRKA